MCKDGAPATSGNPGKNERRISSPQEIVALCNFMQDLFVICRVESLLLFPTFSYFLGSLLLFPTLGSNSYFFLLF